MLLLLLTVVFVFNINYVSASELNSEYNNTLKKYSQVQLLEDLDFLIKTIEETHPNPYFAIGKDKFYSEVDNIKLSITESMNTFEFYSLIAPLITKLKDGHTGIIVPNNLFPNNIKVFPLIVEVRDNKMFTLKIMDDDINIPLTSEILSINGKETHVIIDTLKQYIPGMNDGFKEIILEEDLYSLLWFKYNMISEFEITYKHENSIHTKKVTGVPKELIDNYFKNTYNSEVKHTYKILGDICYLDFNLMKDYPSFKTLLEKMFEEIEVKNINKLIIDIRNNTGGSDGLSNLLISYIYDQPFNQVHRVDLKVSQYSNQGYGNVGDIIVLQEDFKFTHNLKNRFNGKVCLLTNRKSFSGSTMLASTIKDYNIGVIIGEETGGLASQFGNVTKLALPNSNLEFVVSSRYLVRPNGDQTITGVIPHIEFKEPLNTRSTNIDSTLEFAKHFISEDYEKYFNPEDKGVGRNISYIDLINDKTKYPLIDVAKNYYYNMHIGDYDAIYEQISEENKKRLTKEMLIKYIDSSKNMSSKLGKLEEVSVLELYAITYNGQIQKYYINGILNFENLQAPYTLKLNKTKKIQKENVQMTK